MKRIIGLILAATLLLTAVPVFSQVGLYIGGFGGVSMQKPSFDAAQFNNDSTFVYGLRGGLRILMFALEVSYFRAGHNISMEDFATFQWNGLTNDFSYIGANIRWIFPLAILRPYLTAGYGYYTADINSIDKARDGGYNFGAGLEIAFGKISLVADGRYHHVTLHFSNIELGLGDFIATAGLSFNF